MGNIFAFKERKAGIQKTGERARVKKLVDSERLNLFLAYADKHGLILITPKYKPDDLSREWAK